MKLKKFDRIYRHVVNEDYGIPDYRKSLEGMFFSDDKRELADISGPDPLKEPVSSDVIDSLWDEYRNTFGARLTVSKPADIDKYLYITEKVIVMSEENKGDFYIPGDIAKKIIERGLDTVTDKSNKWQLRSHIRKFTDMLRQRNTDKSIDSSQNVYNYWVKISDKSVDLPKEGEDATEGQRRVLLNMVKWMKEQRKSGCIILETDIEDLIIR